MHRIAVFCGANTGTDPAILEAARATGRAIAKRGMGVVFGGGHGGLMGAVADAASANSATHPAIRPANPDQQSG